MKTLLVLALLSSTALCQARPAGDESLAAALYRGEHKVRVLPGDPRDAVFNLTTSWISGEGHKGWFRYKVYAKPAFITHDEEVKNTEPKGGWGDDVFIERLHSCQIWLNVYDEGGFVLRKIPVIFARDIDASGKISGMDTNDSVQMDATDYRRFTRVLPAADSWDLAWICDK